MKKPLFSVAFLSIMLVLFTTSAGLCASTATLSASEYKAGDTVTIEGTIDPGQDLYIAVTSQNTFAPKDTEGVHETKRLNKDAKKAGKVFRKELINQGVDKKTAVELTEKYLEGSNIIRYMQNFR